MKPKYLLPVIFAVLFLVFSVSGQESIRKEKRFNANWKFSSGECISAQEPDFDDSKWESVNLPHDASIKGVFDKENSTGAIGWLPFEEGWYRQNFVVPDTQKGKKVFIRFDGVYRDSKVWINGNLLGRNLNGYLGFEYDLTPFLQYGEENVLAVYYDNRTKGTSRWYTGSGIYRDVHLTIVKPVYVPYHGTYITTPKVSEKLAKVVVETEVINETNEAGTISIETDIFDADGKNISSAKAAVYLDHFNDYKFNQQIEVENPKLWDTENPNLYYAKSKIYFNGILYDEYKTRFGIREIELTPEEGLLLNGKKVFAQGGDIHHDLGCVGAAALKSGYRYRLQLLKDMGCNSIRLSHNPHAPVLLDVCDEMGILVISEAYDKWTSQYYGGEKAFNEMWQTDLERFLKTDRNHPSVYLWSMGNEVLKQNGGFDKKFENKADAADFGAGLLKEMVEYTHKFEPSRKVTAALFPSRKGPVFEWDKWDNHNEFMKSLPPPMAFQMDVVSWNYTGNLFESDLKNYPQMMFVASETGTNLKFGNRKISMLEFDKSYVIGHYYWTALSYLGESPWPRKSWQRAFFSMDEQMTPIGYIYKSLYTEKPMVKIMVLEPDKEKYDFWDKQYDNKRWSWYPMLNHWNFEKNTGIQIQAFSNCEEIELLLNGKSLGSKKIIQGEEPVLYWDLLYAKGELVALGKRNGVVAVTDTLRTAGKAKKLVLTPHKNTSFADGSDLIYVQVSIQDKEGNIVPIDQNIIFEVEGPGNIAGLANSDIFSDESWQGDSKSTKDGRCLIVLRSGYEKGKVLLKAKTKNLVSAEIEFNMN